MRKLISSILVILMLTAGTGWAQTAPGNPPAGKFAPIDVNEQTFPYYDADTGWSTATSTSYSYQGMALTQPKDFERVIKPLNDPTANDLLRSGADKDAWGQGLIWGGVAVEVAGWTDFTVEMLNMGTTTDSSGHMVDHDPNVIPSVVMVLGGVGIFLKGIFTQMDASTDRANAVARYNTVVQSNQDLSMMIQPENNGVGLNLTQTF
jgi:predicted small lipoprotein YifL